MMMMMMISPHLYLTKALSSFLGIVDSLTFKLLTEGENLCIGANISCLLGFHRGQQSTKH